MTRTEIQKYGTAIQRFIKKYNDKILSMNLPSSNQMLRNYSVNELLSLSRFINAIPSRNVRKLLLSMDDDALKQMMLNTLSLFMIPNNRKKYLNQKHHQSRNHHSILRILSNSMKKKVKKRKVKYQEHVFDRLPNCIQCHICSLLDSKSLSNVSFTCHSLCIASTQPSARSHTQLSAHQSSETRTSRYKR